MDDEETRSAIDRAATHNKPTRRRTNTMHSSWPSTIIHSHESPLSLSLSLFPVLLALLRTFVESNKIRKSNIARWHTARSVTGREEALSPPCQCSWTKKLARTTVETQDRESEEAAPPERETREEDEEQHDPLAHSQESDEWDGREKHIDSDELETTTPM